MKKKAEFFGCETVYCKKYCKIVCQNNKKKETEINVVFKEVIVKANVVK